MSEAEYRAAIERIRCLIEKPKLNWFERRELERLASLAEQYELVHFPL